VSLQRRLLLYLLLATPLVWAMAIAVSSGLARREVNELFDTEIVRLARQVQATLAGAAARGPAPPPSQASGEADLRDLAIAVWNAEGRLLLVDREGARIPHRPTAAGFVDIALEGEPWRVYYLQSDGGKWLVAAGQRLAERDELVRDLVFGQMLPWLLLLPVLMAIIAWAVRRALKPLRGIVAELQGRGADNLGPVPERDAPSELRSLLAAMNALFGRIESTRERERRFTADAAHELRTPLAVLRAQWDVMRQSSDATAQRSAAAGLAAGLDRMDRLVSQMLALSRLESTDRLPRTAAIDWRPIVEQAMSDVLPLADRRRIELGCDWPGAGRAAFALQGDAGLLAVLLRNLLDNAVRYAPAGSAVTLRLAPDSLVVDNGGPPMPPTVLARMGERFHRAEGQAEGGSGLGLSIVQRIAALHGLTLRYRTRADGTGVVAEVRVS
jgi:two-component system sensor histidine kinase QseC